MRTFALVLAAAVLASSPAGAAEANICRPYARQIADLVIKFTWFRAYTICLNSDEPPAVPVTALEALSLVEVRPPDDPPVPPARPERPERPIGKSGFPAGSAGWLAWCKRYYPRSFSAADGSVIQPADRRRHTRSPCPG